MHDADGAPKLAIQVTNKIMYESYTFRTHSYSRKMKEVLSSSRIKDFVKQLVLGSSFSESSGKGA